MNIKFKDELWYFAHPYTCKNEKGEYVWAGEEANFRLCCQRAGELIQRGYVIYAPIAHTHPIHQHHPPFVGGEIHDMWYQVDNIFIKKAGFTGIIMAPLWETSKGCCGEKALFEELRQEVLYYRDVVC